MASGDPRALGVFDSGLGGLTVVRALREHMLAEDILYLGDTARVPYGSRSPQTVLRYARKCAAALAAHQVKALVVACNTVSAVALETLSVELDMPVVGVVLPGAQAAAQSTGSGRVGLLATRGTVRSGAYTRACAGLDSRIELHCQAAPLLVPLVEEGWLEGEVPQRVLEHYLHPLLRQHIDTLILGCTHYPMLMSTLHSLLDADHRFVRVVDSAAATAQHLSAFLRARGLTHPDLQRRGGLRILTTDPLQWPSAFVSECLGDAATNTRCDTIDL